MIRIAALALLAVLAVVLQGTVLQQILPGAVTPDLALLLTMGTAWRAGPMAGGLLGLWSGALIGAQGGALLMAFLYALAGWTSGVVAARNVPSAFLMGCAQVASIRGLEVAMLQLTGQSIRLDPTQLAWAMLFHGLALAILEKGLRQWTRDSGWPVGDG